jgi:hypothetical protein
MSAAMPTRSRPLSPIPSRQKLTPSRLSTRWRKAGLKWRSVAGARRFWPGFFSAGFCRGFTRPSSTPPAPPSGPDAGFLAAAGLLLSALDLPFEWHAQFHLEERFGFNTTTAATWWLDRVKGCAAGGGAGLSVAGVDFETGGVAGGGLVVLGLGLRGAVSTGHDAGRAGFDSAAVQQIHPLPAGRIARRPARPGPARRLSRPRHPGDGRQQTVPPFQRLFHRAGPVPQNCSV